MSRTDPVPDLTDLSHLTDVRAVLAALNSRAGAGEMDRIPVEVTYCTIVRDGRQPFRVADALADLRLTTHPSRAAVRAYCGVPLADTDGRIFGTLCHFDYDPRDIPEEEESVMTRVAPLLSRLASPSGSSRP
jgi:GAF domain-containing protein